MATTKIWEQRFSTKIVELEIVKNQQFKVDRLKITLGELGRWTLFKD